MATKKKTPASVTIAPEAKAPRLKKDGTPWAKVEKKRSAAELVAHYTTKRNALIVSFNKTLAKYDSRIAKFSASSVTGEEAAKELLADGLSVAEIDAMEAKVRKARAALKDKSPEEIEAMRQAAMASKEPVVTYDEDESDDE